MPLPAIVAAIPAIAAAGTALANTIGAADAARADQRNADQNLQLQRDTLAYQRELQDRIFAREDNAVQRRAADMRAAGLSPVLAAGNPANAGSVIQPVTPQADTQHGERESRVASARSSMVTQTANALQLAQLQANVDRTNAESDWIRQQAQQSAAQQPGLLESQSLANQLAAGTQGAQISHMQEQVIGAKLDNEFKRLTQDASVLYTLRQVDQQEAQLAISKLDALLRKENVTQAQLDIVAKRLANEFAKKGMDLKLGQEQMEVFIKAATLKSMDIANARGGYASVTEGLNANFWKQLDMPPVIVDLLTKMLGSAIGGRR